MIKEDKRQACRGGSCLICLEELWGWGSEVSTRGFVSRTNTRIMVLWAGRTPKEQGALQEQRAGLWSSEESKEPSSLMSSFGTEKVPRETFWNFPDPAEEAEGLKRPSGSLQTSTSLS